MSKFFQWLTIMLAALVMGVFWGTWFTLTRSIENFPPDSFLLIGKTIIKNVAVPMRILLPLTLLCMVILCLYFRKNTAQLYWNIGALILMIVTLLITVMIEVPIDNQIKTWNPETIPADWQSTRDYWESFHTARTFISLVGTAFFLWALLNRKST